MPNTLPQISFGTDGWRAIIADEYTFENVRACALAVALELEQNVITRGQNVIPAEAGTHRGVAIGYDTRFQSQNFAQAAAETIANRGIPVQLSDRPLPTPALSLAVTNMNAAAGVMITASHNPPDYNGFKVKSEAGGSAPPDQVARIESHLPKALSQQGFPPLAGEMSEGQRGTNTPAGEMSEGQRRSGQTAPIQTVNMVTPYLDQLASLVDIEAIKSAGINIAVDSMHGSGANIVATLLQGGKSQVTEIRSEINPVFPGMKQPEPVDENLEPLISLITDKTQGFPRSAGEMSEGQRGYLPLHQAGTSRERETSRFDVGLATDGDADRLGVVAENGTYLTTLEVFSMLFHHLKSRRKLPGGAACTITMSSMMDRLAEHHNTDLYRTPVGFKFVGPAMTDNACVLGGEESGGYAFAGHIPERDGPLSALYFLESMAISGKTPTQLLDEIHQITGPHTFRRIDIEFTPDQRDRIASALSSDAPKTLGNLTVLNEDRRDGIRLDLQNNAWAVVRLSGTEPLIRIYAEAPTPQIRDKVLKDFCTLLNV